METPEERAARLAKAERTVEFKGETFELSGEEVSEVALMDVAAGRTAETSEEQADALAAIKALLRDIIAEADWPRFWAHGRKTKAKIETDFMPVIQYAMEQSAERPTGRPSDSSDGPSTTQGESESKLDAQVTGMFAGRPDLQAGILRAVNG